MRADLYEKTGELLLAIGDYDKAISINPYYSDLYHYRAQLKEQIGDNAGAAQDRLRYEELERDESERKKRINLKPQSKTQEHDAKKEKIVPQKSDGFVHRL